MNKFKNIAMVFFTFIVPIIILVLYPEKMLTALINVRVYILGVVAALISAFFGISYNRTAQLDDKKSLTAQQKAKVLGFKKEIRKTSFQMLAKSIFWIIIAYITFSVFEKISDHIYLLSIFVVYFAIYFYLTVHSFIRMIEKVDDAIQKAQETEAKEIAKKELLDSMRKAKKEYKKNYASSKNTDQHLLNYRNLIN